MANAKSEPKVVAGQRELETIYSACRKADLGAEQHERLRGLAQSVLGILEKASVNGEVETPSKKSDDEKGEDKPDATDVDR